MFNNILVPNYGKLALHIRERPDYYIDFHTVQADGNLIWAPNHEITMAWSYNVYTSVRDYKRLNRYGWGQNTIEADPQLANPAAQNFRPRSNSPAIDSAVQSSAPSRDMDGVGRVDGDGDGVTRADRGAYEY